MKTLSRMFIWFLSLDWLAKIAAAREAKKKTRWTVFDLDGYRIKVTEPGTSIAEAFKTGDSGFLSNACGVGTLEEIDGVERVGGDCAAPGLGSKETQTLVEGEKVQVKAGDPVEFEGTFIRIEDEQLGNALVFKLRHGVVIITLDIYTQID